MRSTVNFFFLFFCYRLVVTIPLVENTINQKLQNDQKLNVNNARLPNSVYNPFLISYNRNFHPVVHDYESSSKYYLPYYYDAYWPPILPFPPLIPTSHRPQYVLPPLYNILDSYNTDHLNEPMKHLQNDERFDEEKLVYPIGNIKFEEKLTDETASDVKNILSKTVVRNHYMSSKKKYMIIHPNGTVEDVDNLESVVAQYPNYVKVNGADIIPKKNGSPVETSEHELHTSSILKGKPELQLNQLVLKNESPKSIVNVEELVENTFQNDDDSAIVFSGKVADSNTPIKDTPKTITEINRRIIPSSYNSAAKTQPEKVVDIRPPTKISEDIIRRVDLSQMKTKQKDSSNVSTRSFEKLPSIYVESEADITFNPFTDFEDDVIPNSFDYIKKDTVTNPLDEDASSNIDSDPITGRITRVCDDSGNMFKLSQINESNLNENTTEENYVKKNKFIDQVPTIEDGSGDILSKSITLTNDTNILSSLFDEIPLPLETDKGSNFHDTPNPYDEDFHSETSNQFGENKDISKENYSNQFAVNSTPIYNEDVLDILAVKNSAEIVKDLLTARETDESELTTSVPWTDTSDNTEDYYETKSSEINIPSKSTVPDVTTTADEANPTTTEKQNVYFKIAKDFWEKLKNKEIPFDILYFLQAKDEPVTEKDNVEYPNGTVVTYENVREGKEDNQPIILKNIDVKDPNSKELTELEADVDKF